MTDAEMLKVIIDSLLFIGLWVLGSVMLGIIANAMNESIDVNEPKDLEKKDEKCKEKKSKN